MRAAALLQTTLSEAGRVDAASCSSNVALGRPITNPRTGLAGRLKAPAQRGPNPDSLLSDQRAVVRKYQRSQGADPALPSQRRAWEAHGKQRAKKSPPKRAKSLLSWKHQRLSRPPARPRSCPIMARVRRCSRRVPARSCDPVFQNITGTSRMQHGAALIRRDPGDRRAKRAWDRRAGEAS